MPKTVSNRQLRRTVVQHQQALEEGFAPALRGAIEKLNAVQEEAHGEYKRTWELLREHEARLDTLQQQRTFWQRLRWLLTGK